MPAQALAFRCPACGGINRVDPGRLEAGPKCGKCATPLPLDARPLDVDDEQLARLVASSPVPVLVDFHATWCGPCKLVAPIVAVLARERAGRLIAVKVDIDRAQRHAGELGVRSVPTFALYRAGQLVRTQSGALPRPALEAFVDAP